MCHFLRGIKVGRYIFLQRFQNSCASNWEVFQDCLTPSALIKCPGGTVGRILPLRRVMGERYLKSSISLETGVKGLLFKTPWTSQKNVRSSSPEISLKNFSFKMSKINFLVMPTNLSQHPALWGAKGGIWHQDTKWELSLSNTLRQSIVFKLFCNSLAPPP